jgi:iron-sulfur cluster repair protein YtfE (RIC family)
VDILETDAEDQAFDAKLKVLEQEVMRHVAKEETTLFPKVREILDQAKLEKLGALMAETAKQLEEEGEPRERVFGERQSPAPI